MTRTYNKAEIMRYAHYLRNEYNMTMSAALKSARRNAKESPTGKLHINQKTQLQMAFKAKYPTGTLSLHQFCRGATVQFTAGGKVYTYKNYGWQHRLGLVA